LLLIFPSQKIVQNVRDEMAEFVVPLRKKVEDSLIRQVYKLGLTASQVVRLIGLLLVFASQK